MAKNKPAVEKELPSPFQAHQTGVDLMIEAVYKLRNLNLDLTGFGLMQEYNVNKCIDALTRCVVDSHSDSVIDQRPFAAAWLKMLNHYIESAVWCFVYNSNRGVLPEKKAGSLADTALAEYRKVALAHGVE